MTQNKYITEHLSRLKYTEVKNLPKTNPSPNLPIERPPKQFLVKFTQNPIDSFDRRYSQGPSHLSNSQGEFYDSQQESLKRQGNAYKNGYNNPEYSSTKQRPPPIIVENNMNMRQSENSGGETLKRQGFGGFEAITTESARSRNNNNGFESKGNAGFEYEKEINERTSNLIHNKNNNLTHNKQFEVSSSKSKFKGNSGNEFENLQEKFGNESVKRQGHGLNIRDDQERTGLGAQNAIKKPVGYEGSLVRLSNYENEDSSSRAQHKEYDAFNNYRQNAIGGSQFNERQSNQPKEGIFRSEIIPSININGPQGDRRKFEFNYSHEESAKRSGQSQNRYQDLNYQDRPQMPQESVKRSHIQIEGERNLISQIEILEMEVKRLRDENQRLEGDNLRARTLIQENERLEDNLKQYRISISNFQDMERINRQLNEELSKTKQKLEDYELHLADNRDLEARIHEEYSFKLNSEMSLHEKTRRELQQMKNLEEKFYKMQEEKLSLEEEIESIRMIKLTLESQLEKLRMSYQEIEEEITIKVQNEYEMRLKEMERKLNNMSRELQEKEGRIRANFDRELLEVNSVNRSLKEQMNIKEEHLKKSSQNERFILNLKEEIVALTNDLEIEIKSRNILESKLKSMNQQLQANMNEIDAKTSELNHLKIELESRPSVTFEKERMLEEVVIELEKINQAFRLCKDERDSLRKEIAEMRGNLEGNLHWKRELDFLHKEKESLNIKIGELMHNNNQLKIDYDSLRNNQVSKYEIDGLNIKINELTRVGLKMKEEYDRLAREKEGLQMKCSDLSSKLQEYENLTNNLRSEHEKVKKSAGVKSNLEDEIRGLRRSLELSVKERDELYAKLKELEFILKEKESSHSGLQNRVRDSEILIRENRALKNQFEDIIREKEALQFKLKDFDLLLREKESLQVKLRDIERMLKEKEASHGSLQNRIRESELLIRDNEGLKNRLREFEGIIREKEVLQFKLKDFDLLVREKESLQAKLRDNEMIIKEKEGSQAEVMRVGHRLKQDFESALIEKEQLLLQLKESEDGFKRFDQLKRQIEEENHFLRQEKSELLLKINELKSNLNTQLEIVRGLKERDTQNTQARFENKHLQDQISQMSNEIQIWKERYQGLEIQSREEKIGVERVKKSHMNKVNEDKEREIYEIKQRYEKEIEGLKIQVGELRKKSNMVPILNINENDIRMKYEAQLTSLETKVMTIQMEKDQLADRLEELMRENRGLKENNQRLEIGYESIRNRTDNSSEMLNLMKENENYKLKQMVFYC